MSGPIDDAIVRFATEGEKPTSPRVGQRDLGMSPLLPGSSFDPQDSSLDRRGRPNDYRMSRLLTVDQVATLLNVPRKWVYRRVGLKPPEGIPHVKVGKYLRFRETDVRDFVERLRRN